MIISKRFFLLENEKRLTEEWFTAEFSVTLRVIVKEKNKLSWFAPDKDLLRELRDIVGFTERMITSTFGPAMLLFTQQLRDFLLNRKRAFSCKGHKEVGRFI